jgi:hypothetical protein
VQPPEENISKGWVCDESDHPLKLIVQSARERASELSNPHITVQRSMADLVNDTWDQEVSGF